MNSELNLRPLAIALAVAATLAAATIVTVATALPSYAAEAAATGPAEPASKPWLDKSLSADKRAKLPSKDFGLPEKARTPKAKKESGNYPMPDKEHAATFAYTSTAFPMLTGTLVTVAGFIPVGLNNSAAGEFTFTLFVVMMWVATERVSYLVIGVVLFGAVGAIVRRQRTARSVRTKRPRNRLVSK